MRERRPVPPQNVSARFLLLLGGALLALGAPAAAEGPSGGAVVRGKAAISQNAKRTTIRQLSNRAVIDWRGFDVGRGHRVVFDQPGRSSATLNRVGSARRSVIEGAIEAPGTVILQNRAGVIFAGTARIDTGGLVAASQDVDAARFQRDGRLAIGGGERDGAQVVNAGRITVGGAGLAALVGSDVENAGAIVARRGVVALASGARTTIDLAGDGLVRFAVAGHAPGAARGVGNSGLIDAGDGRVVLSAGSAARMLDAAINTSGVIRAASGRGDGGRVELVGRGAGEIRIGGAIDVSGGRRGGAVTATGAGIAVERQARIDARGGIDGGAVRLGGDRRGAGPLRRAERLRMAAGAEIDAGGATGRGGVVVLWSDGVTRHDGAISATGPASGGFVETSGRFALEVGPQGSVEVGPGGRWLLDPRDIAIGTGGLASAPPGGVNPPPGDTVYTIDRLAIVNTLNGGGDVTISTVQPASAMAGDITVSAPLAWSGDGSLRLEAERDIRISAAINADGGDFTAVAARDVVTSAAIGGAGDLTLEAGRSVAVNQNIRATGAGDVALLARTGNVSVTEAPASNVIVATASGALSLAAPEGSVLLRRVNPMAGANIQVFSASGPVDVAAGARILLEGGAQGGRWVRIGQAASASDVRLTASEVRVQGGGVGNTFAEVVAGPGGSIRIEADAISVLNGAGDQGRVQALGGASLDLFGESQTWNGPVRAGNGASNGGEVTVAGAITAGFQPQFSLAPGFGFTLRPAAPGGGASSYTSSQPFVVTTTGAGAIEIGAPVIAEQITLETEERVGLGLAGRLTGTGLGDALVVAAGRGFRNDASAGAAALETADAGARWLLYLDAFAGLTGPGPAPRGFDLYGRSYGAAPPPALGFDGDRIVYAERPRLVLTAETLSKTYGVAAAPGFAAAGLRAGDSLATALLHAPDVTSAGAAADADAGAYVTAVAAAASDQGYVVDLVDGALAVTPAALTVTAEDRTRSYGAANPALGARYTGFVLGQNAGDLDGALTLTTGATASSDVGSYAIRADGLRSGNYAIAYADGALAVTPAALTITAENKTRSYGAANPPLSARFAGFVLGQDAGDLGGSLSLTTGATASSNVGRYTIRAGGLRSGNYAIAYADGALAVTPAALTVTPSGTRTYGGGDADFDPRFTGLVLGQGAGDLGGALVYSTPASIDSDVGAYALTASGLTSTNYAISYAEGTLTIDPAALIVTAEDETRSYGAANPALSARYDGFVLGQDAGDLGGALSLTTGATASSDVGRYAIEAGGLRSGNYAITYADGALAVTPAALTVTAEDETRSYGAANPALSARFDGFVLGQDAGDLGGDLTVSTGATARSDVGRYAIRASGLRSGNYAIAYVDGDLAVSPAALTITPEGRRTYGSAEADVSPAFTGFVLGQGADDLGGALVYTTAASADSDVGAYALTARGLTSTNYAIDWAPGTLTIDPAALTVTAEDRTRSYGAANPALGARYAGFVLGQDAGDLGGALTLATTANAASDVGRYAIRASGLRSGNYAIAYENGALAVTPAALTVTAEDRTRSYGAANPALGARYAGFVLGQDADDLGGRLALTTGASAASDVGRYAIRASGLRSGNYTVAYEDGALAVTPAALTVTAEDRTRTYGAANPALGARYAGFVLGQDAGDLGGGLTLTTGANAASDVGRYAIRASGLRSGNYAIAYEDGALAVTPAALTVTANDAGRAEGRANPDFTARYAGFVLGQDASALKGTLVLATEATRASGPGRYAIAGSGLSSGNYAIAYEDGVLTVRPGPTAPPPAGGAAVAGLDQGLESFGRGVPPFTPGDSAFRTTQTEAPTARDSTFELTYSLGEIAQAVPPGGADTGGFAPAAGGEDTGGFVPAAGGADTGGFVPAAGGAPAPACGGPIATGAAVENCAPAPESFWTTVFPARAR